MKEYVVEIQGKKLNYRHLGKGPCMVLLHGIPTHSGLWEGVMHQLKNTYSIYAFDLLGFGKSDRPGSSEINIESQARIFVELFNKLDINDLVLVGHDIGGGIAQIIAVSNPEILKALILIDSVCYDSWPIELLKVESKVQMLFEHLPADVLGDLFVRYMRDGFYNRDRTGAAVQKYWEYINTQEGVAGFLELVQSFDSSYTMKIAPYLKNIRTPALILWGKHDMFIRLSYGYRLSEDIRGSVIQVIDDAGHFLPEDQPEKTARCIHDFVAAECI